MIAGGRTRITLPHPRDRAGAYRIALTRLPALGAVPAGSWDSTPGSPTFGTFLHLEASLPSYGTQLVTDARAALDPAPILQEWDTEGTEIFPPGCTQLFLVGGEGRYGVSFERVPCSDELAYYPRTRRLLRRVPRNGGTFTVPNGHTGIGTLGAASTLVNISDPATPILLTSAWPTQITPGTILATAVGADALLVWTSFSA